MCRDVNDIQHGSMRSIGHRRSTEADIANGPASSLVDTCLVNNGRINALMHALHVDPCSSLPRPCPNHLAQKARQDPLHPLCARVPQLALLPCPLVLILPLFRFGRLLRACARARGLALLRDLGGRPSAGERRRHEQLGRVHDEHDVFEGLGRFVLGRSASFP